MSGPMASTSRRDRGAGTRASQLLKFVAFQSLVALGLAIFAVVLRDDRRALWLCLVTLLVPVGWALVAIVGHQRLERARKAGTWTMDLERSQSKRTGGMLGIIVLVWVLVAALVALYA